MGTGSKRKKIIVVTGTKAYPIIVEMVERARSLVKEVDISVELLPFPVIGMASVNSIKSIVLRKPDLLERLRTADYILLPGKVEGDATELEKVIGKPVYKGTLEPSHMVEIVKMILSGEELSRTEPADKFIESTRIESLVRVLHEAYSSFREAFRVGDIRVPVRGPPVLVASETTVTLSPEEAAEQAVYFEERGADIVIVGVPYGEDTGDSLRRLKAVDKVLNKALIAIDSASPHTLKKAVEQGVELVFSLHAGNMDYLRTTAKKAAYVVIPGDPYKGVTPTTEGDSIAMLLKNIEKARNMGYDRLVADLILPPPILGLSRMVSAYLTLSKTLPDTPLMAGLANVTELVDADSIGVNAILSIMSVEIGLSMVLVSEESGKATGSTLETKLGLTLAAAAKMKGSAPVGQGIDLLVAKDKKKPVSKKIWMGAGKLIDVPREEEQHSLDSWGYLVIDVDYDNGLIIACVNPLKGNTICYRGEEPGPLMRRIIREHPEFSKEHAGYVGIELEKAYVALKLRKQYVQDEDVISSLEDRYGGFIEKLRDMERNIREGKKPNSSKE